MEVRLSKYGQASTRPSPASRMMSEFAGDFRDGVDINLGVGYVNEDTIPVAYLAEAMEAVAGDGVKYRQAFNYGSPAGSANLIASIRRFLVEMRIGGLDQAAIEGKLLAIGACGATSLLDGLADVIERGIVVTSDPMYYIYSDALERKGFELLAVPEDAEGINLEALERKLRALGAAAQRISFFYTVTVNNPSCTILSNARRRALLQAASALSRQQGRLRAGARWSADARAGAEDRRPRFQRAAVRSGDVRLPARPPDRGAVAGGECRLSPEGGRRARGD
ncbi:MAG: aminotransferase class I/II-fold pyridoxal phosphate-dependent enzyme [Acidobacteria bacterium]|nr:aminotransferase class I/II-fold pyridoxal phosphate-dependent enzyme [Acidobacteriota bacterium]